MSSLQQLKCGKYRFRLPDVRISRYFVCCYRVAVVEGRSEGNVTHTPLFLTNRSLLFVLKDDKTLEINEEMEGWTSLVEKLPEYLPGCQKLEEWFLPVAVPAFKPNVTEIYKSKG